MQHESQSQRVPVTALAFFKSGVVISGEGSYVKVYHEGSKLSRQEPVFQVQVVHGIIVNQASNGPTVALIWGGRLLRPATLRSPDDGSLAIKFGGIINNGDWILAAAFNPNHTHHDRSIAAVVTAHSALSAVQIHEDYVKTATTKPLLAGSNCLLYSAHIIWLSPFRCLIASGTAFGDVIVWSATLSTADDRLSAHSQTHYTFSAHEGSVFGVQISKLLNLPNSNCTRALASCSDDRIIKIWDISDPDDHNPIFAQVHRNTGYGSPNDNDAHAPSLLAKAMGHISRIWHVQFLNAVDLNAFPNLLSFGEDASVVKWAVKLAQGDPVNGVYNLDQLQSTTAHAGKNIWAVAFDKTHSPRLATGGADGSIVLQTTHNPIDSDSEVPSTLLKDTDGDDNYKAYCFVDTRFLLATTNRGRVALVDISSAYNAVGVTELSAALHGLRGYSIVAGVLGVGFVAGTDGAVHICFPIQRRRAMLKVAQTKGKTAGLFAYRLELGAVALLITGIESATAELLLFERQRNSRSLHDRPSSTGRLNLPPGIIVTSFACYAKDDHVIAILGSRSGSIAIFKTTATRGAKDTLEPLLLEDEIHGKEAITDLRWLQKDSRSWLYSTGRDGTIAIHGVSIANSTIGVELVHQLNLPFGPNIEGLRILDSKLIVWGFKSKHFIAYDITAQAEQVVVECGGAKRSWAYEADTNTFVWTKATQVFYHKIPSAHQPNRINSGGHGREIKALAISPGKPQIIATGAEDTDIKLWKLEDGVFGCLSTLRKHNTGIQHLQWSSGGRYLFSSGGFEEFFIWRVRTGIPYLGAGVLCESAHPRSGASDLRIMGFSVDEAPEIDGFRVTMAYSDSTLKMWHYENRAWTMIAAADYLTSCIMHVLRVSEENEDLVTTASDGHIAYWQLDAGRKQLTWSHRHKVHQNAIHAAIKVEHPSNGTRLIVTGGDDNAIGFTRLDTMQTLLIPRAHAAAVTGLAITPADEKTSTYWLVSAGIDQRVKLWKLSLDFEQHGVEGITIERVEDVFTAVADVSSLELCKLEDGGLGVLVCGVGMDLWRVPSTPEVQEVE